MQDPCIAHQLIYKLSPTGSYFKVISAGCRQEYTSPALREITPYIFTAALRSGKEIFIPEALSRAPVSRPAQDELPELRHVISSPHYLCWSSYGEGQIYNSRDSSLSARHFQVSSSQESLITDCEAFGRQPLGLSKTPNHTERSPAIVVNTVIHSSKCRGNSEEWLAWADSCDRRAAKRARDADPSSSRARAPSPGIQNPTTKRWRWDGRKMKRPPYQDCEWTCIVEKQAFSSTSTGLCGRKVSCRWVL